MNQGFSQSKTSLIRDVWASNLEEEMRVIRELILDYPYVAADTEFPGVVAKPIGNFKTLMEYYYQTIRLNVNMLKIIQLGISLFNEKGEVPDGCCTWQFNFRFSLSDDTYAQDSIDLLTHGGINFALLERDGIEVPRFAYMLYSSGLVINPDVKWLGFHAAYDFGYLIKGLTSPLPLPETEEAFTQTFRQLFPSVYDIKYLMRQFTDVAHNAGLDFLADTLNVRRLGTAHQAGSDSLLTGHCFFKLIRDKLKVIPESANGVLYGLKDDQGAMTPSTPYGSSMGAFPNTPTVPRDVPRSNTGSVPHTPSGFAGNSAGSPSSVSSLAMHGGSRDSKVHVGTK